MHVCACVCVPVTDVRRGLAIEVRRESVHVDNRAVALFVDTIHANNRHLPDRRPWYWLSLFGVSFEGEPHKHVDINPLHRWQHSDVSQLVQKKVPNINVFFLSLKALKLQYLRAYQSCPSPGRCGPMGGVPTLISRNTRFHLSRNYTAGKCVF